MRSSSPSSRPPRRCSRAWPCQDRLWQYNRSALDAERLDVRVAINVGEVRLESNDVFGEPVNIASRVEGIAEAGEVFFTEAVYLAMNKAEVPSQEVGVFELKGIPGKIRVFRVPSGPYRIEAPMSRCPLRPASLDRGAAVRNLALSRLGDPALSAGAALSVAASARRLWEARPRGLPRGGGLSRRARPGRPSACRRSSRQASCRDDRAPPGAGLRRCWRWCWAWRWWCSAPAPRSGHQ